VVIPSQFYRGDYLSQVQLIAHEIAHQWFGALVTYKDHTDVFVHEGFATYLDKVYVATELSSFVGEKFLEEKISLYYPSMVHGRYTAVYSRWRFVNTLEAFLGNKAFSGAEVEKILDLFFGKTLPAAIKARFLASAPVSGWDKNSFVRALYDLPFENMTFIYQNYLEVAKLTQGNVGAFTLHPNLSQFTPPANIRRGDILFNRGVYERGALSLHALRLRVGNNTFWKLLSGFLEQYKFSNASVDDWLAVVEKTSGREVHTFHETWLRDPVVPDFPELGLKKSDFKLGVDFK
jgi:aminopeptidase N